MKSLIVKFQYWIFKKFVLANPIYVAKERIKTLIKAELSNTEALMSWNPGILLSDMSKKEKTELAERIKKIPIRELEYLKSVILGIRKEIAKINST